VSILIEAVSPFNDSSGLLKYDDNAKDHHHEIYAVNVEQHYPFQCRKIYVMDDGPSRQLLKVYRVKASFS
jgi:hypothetical protein